MLRQKKNNQTRSCLQASTACQIQLCLHLEKSFLERLQILFYFFPPIFVFLFPFSKDSTVHRHTSFKEETTPPENHWERHWSVTSLLAMHSPHHHCNLSLAFRAGTKANLKQGNFKSCNILHFITVRITCRNQAGINSLQLHAKDLK